MSHMGVGKVLSGNKCPMVISAYPEDPELEGVAKRPMAEIQHSEDPELEGVAKRPTAKIQHPEDPELEGVAKRPTAKIQHPEEEEDTTSVFTHCTSVEPVANPWESTMRVCLNVRLQIL
jgi:hypothetical protein